MPQCEDDPFVADILRIEASERADAQCIADALAEYAARLESDGESSVVLVGLIRGGAMLLGLLAALKSCLDANGTGAVTLTVDDRHYVMEGVPPNT